MSLFGSALLLSGVGGCGSPPGPSGLPTELPVLQLSSKPTQQIGMMEGDSDYVFVDIVSSAHARSGDLFVSDAGISEILQYAPDGTFVRRIGRRGRGPGEFGSLSRAYVGPSDSILALDGFNERVSVFDSSGDYVRQMDARLLTGDSLFTGDVWLYGRYWIDGALHAEDRARVRTLLDGLPAPTSAPGYRFVRVDRDGRLWIREPRVGAGDSHLWTLVDANGRLAGSLAIPVRFQPQEIRGDEMTGRWRGEDDVNFVRTYTFSETGQVRRTPSWLTAPPAPPTATGEQEEFLAAVKSQLKHMASAQEIHYADAGSYTENIDSLTAFQPDPSVHVDIINGDSHGWSAVFTHPGLDRICGLTYGAGGPAGWVPGHILCGPPARADSTSNAPR